MASFTYTARDANGKTTSGSLTKDNRQAVVADLRRKGLTPVRIKEESREGAGTRRAGAKAGRTARDRKVKPQDMVLFTRQLATIVDAGLPLMQGLDILEKQTTDENFKRILRDIGVDVESGQTFSDTLRKHPKAFPTMYVSMVRAGEASGNLDEILAQLASYLEASEALKHKIKSAMTYPTVAFVLVVGIASFLIIWVVPKFKDIFDSLGGNLPASTQLLITVSNAMNDHLILIFLFLVAAFIGFKFWLKTDAGKFQWDSLKLKFPVFGPLMSKVAISRFTRTFSTLTRSGVPILAALEIVENTAGNEVFARAISNSKNSVRSGQTLADPLEEANVFPPMVTRMIAVGEKTGALESLLLKVSEFYDSEVDATVSQLTSLIEPLMIAVLGLVVGGIVFALFMPIFGLSEAVRGPGP